MPYEKHEIQMTCSNEKAWIDDCIILKNAKLVWKSLWDSNWLKDLVSGQRILQIQMSLFLYLLNMATIIRISYPEKSNRVQSRSCHVSLIKLDIVVVKNWNQWNLYILASLMTNGKIGLNSIGNLCHLLCQIPLYFGLECNMSCLQSMFNSHIFNKINLLDSLQLIECIKWLI